MINCHSMSKEYLKIVLLFLCGSIGLLTVSFQKSSLNAFVTNKSQPVNNISDNYPFSNKPPKQKGISLGLFNSDPDFDYINHLQEIKATGADHVQITSVWFQKDIYSHEFYMIKGQSTPNETLIKTIRQAQSLGLDVFLFPIFQVEKQYEPTHWKGTIAPKNKDLWYQNYFSWISQFAKISQQEKVKLLSIGSELNSMDQDTDNWKNIISELRKQYDGMLTYSSNWDHFDKVQFWDDLDLLGVTGYFELTPIKKSPQIDYLIHSWRENYIKLMRWQNRWKKLILFTEVGYRSQKGACAYPWKWGDDPKISLLEQRLGFDSFIKTWNNEKRLEGLYIWNWYGNGGVNCTDYTPKGKPAEIIIKNWFTDLTGFDL